MAGSADPTNEEVLENLQFNVGRISQAQKEIIRRLAVNMPGKIAYLNDLLGLPSGMGIPVPESYGVAPSGLLSDTYLNSILCRVTVATSNNGVGTFKQFAEVTVYSVDRRIETATQVEDAFDRAAVVIGILLKYLTGCVDLQGRTVWRALQPAGHALTLPAAWAAGYSGSTASFTLVQDQSCQCWS